MHGSYGILEYLINRRSVGSLIMYKCNTYDEFNEQIVKGESSNDSLALIR